MSCGCGGGGGNTSYSPQIIFQQQNTPPDPNCPYIISILTAWRNYLQCIQREGLLDLYSVSNATINKYVGIVISAINYPSNICYFRIQLDGIQGLINQIINSGRCQ